MVGKHLAFASVVTVALISAITWAAAPGTPAAGGAGAGMAGRGVARGGAGGAPANLSGAMRDMSQNYTALKADAPDPEKAEAAIREICTFQRDVAIAKLQVPPTLADLKADEKAKGLASYRATLSGLLRTTLDLEDAVNDKKSDTVKTLLAKMDDIQKKGHAEFR